jgi:hypothetical protein
MRRFAMQHDGSLVISCQVNKDTDSSPFHIDPYGKITEDLDYSKVKAYFEEHKVRRDAMKAAEAAKR